MNDKNNFVNELTKKKIEYYCAYQERCKQDVKNKLISMNISSHQIESIIQHLLENDFLNEQRFAKVYARGKFRIKKWGKMRIIRELKAKNISNNYIDSSIKEINKTEYYNVFNDLAQKRFLEINETNIYKKRKKLADYLLYRGWESNLVYEKTLELIP